MRIYLIISLLIITSNSLFAQWECRSKMGASLKPIGESNLMWAGELVGSTGYLSNSTISNTMGFLGLDYTGGNSTLYFEGGFKYWNQYDFDTNFEFDNFRWGLRELFYSYRCDYGKLTVGLQSSKLGDQYLLNERILGLSYQRNSDNWKINITAGSVSDDFSRNGTFCSTCYLYDIIPGRSINNIGSGIGETNMLGFTLGFNPGKKSSQSPNDEFGSMDEFETPSLISVDEVGLAIYSEFGSEVNTSFFTSGLYANIKLPGEINFKPEVLFQSAEGNNGLISVLTLDKNLLWNNGHKTSLMASHYGFTEIDDEAIVLNRFSNILAGEVLRLDATEMPLFLLSAKHTIPKIKTHFKCQYAFSNPTTSMQEFDIQAGKTFFKRLQANAIFGYVKSDLIPVDDSALLGRLELRLNF
ncbi:MULTISPECIES: hypothetical protein [unclassified Saccharicrinis]|uniref:hypothetical protein n=1 Tax=unclassified Saccharicrinis TaxID=2646859 RepID=UPI003D32F170